MDNIIIKDSDGTTNVTYKAIVGASGDGSPAIYRNESVGTTPAEFPVLKISTRSNGPKTSRRMTVDYMWPLMTQDAGGNKTPNGGMSGTTSVLIPQSQSIAQIEKQVHQYLNAVASAIVKQAAISGAAPRS